MGTLESHCNQKYNMRLDILNLVRMGCHNERRRAKKE